MNIYTISNNFSSKGATISRKKVHDYEIISIEVGEYGRGRREDSIIVDEKLIDKKEITFSVIENAHDCKSFSYKDGIGIYHSNFENEEPSIEKFSEEGFRNELKKYPGYVPLKKEKKIVSPIEIGEYCDGIVRKENGKDICDRYATIEYYIQMEKQIIEKADLGATKSGKPKLFPEKKKDENQVLVVFKTGIGYRGHNKHCGDLAPGHTYEEDFSSEKWLPFPGKILATGEIAQGAAGRMGSGSQIIALLKVGDIVSICLSGRMYGRPNIHHVWVKNVDEIIIMTPDDRMATDAF